MKKNDGGLQDAIDNLISRPQTGHNVDTTGPQAGHNEATTGPQRVTMKPYHIRLAASDMEELEAIARQEGTTTAALIRRAVKQLLRA